MLASQMPRPLQFPDIPLMMVSGVVQNRALMALLALMNVLGHGPMESELSRTQLPTVPSDVLSMP